MNYKNILLAGVASTLLAGQAFGQLYNPNLSWQDSYAVDGVCYCNSNGFDHGADTLVIDTPIGPLLAPQVCSDIQSVLGEGRTSGRIPYNDLQCGNGPPNNAGDEDADACPGRVDIGPDGCQMIGPRWDLDAVYGTDTGTDAIVQMVKSNRSRFAIDGDGGGANFQNVYLWRENENNDNQRWVEINRGNGYYSYQKFGTNFCIDGDHGGSRGQNIYLYRCIANEQNQHWLKVNISGDTYRLEKRNAPGFSIDGGRRGSCDP